MSSPIVTATVQATLLSALSNVLGQLIACWQEGVRKAFLRLGRQLDTYGSQGPYSLNLKELATFAAFSLLSCPPNVLWQIWLEATFPAYTESLSPKEKERLVDEVVTGESTATDKTGLRSRNEKQAAATKDSAPDPQKAKKQLSIKNTAVKFLLDQTLGAGVNTVLFIMGIAMLRGQSWQSGWQETKVGFWPLVSAGQKLWPAVSLLNLTLVPVEQRTLVGSLVGVGWGVFLSLMSGGKAKKA